MKILGGAGRWRGGTGTTIEFETFSPYTTVTSRCAWNAICFRRRDAWEARPGTTGYTTLNPVCEPRARRRQDRHSRAWRPVTSCASARRADGGFGDPLERPAEMVRDDLLGRLHLLRHVTQYLRRGHGPRRPARSHEDSIMASTNRPRPGMARPPAFSFGDTRGIAITHAGPTSCTMRS